MASYHTEMPNTDFAITTVNIPDRLDQRDLDDRKQEEEESSIYAQRRLAWRVWLRRGIPWLILALVLLLLGSWLSAQREAMTASRISQRLSTALRLQVRIQDTHLRAAPVPALVLSGVDLGTRMHLDEVAVQFAASSLWQAILSGHRRWGDVVVSPVSVNYDQARTALSWLALLGQAVPDSVSRVRVEEVRFAGTALLPDHYEAITRRDPAGRFTSLLLRRSDRPGTMQIQFTPDDATGNVAFQCDAADWQPPFAPKTAWSEFVASGHVGDAGLDVDKYSIVAAFGGIDGSLAIHRRDHGSPAWLLSGTASSVGLDLSALVQQVTHQPAPADDEKEKAKVFAVAGMAAIEASLVGGADTLEGALADMAAEGRVQVRNTLINGINLGMLASHPTESGNGNGGATRFSEFSAQVVAGSHGVTLRQIHGSAGAMSTRGELLVGKDLGLSGLLHVDLGGSRIQAPLRLRIGGTIGHPTYTP
jgi:hypothetical protein